MLASLAGLANACLLPRWSQAASPEAYLQVRRTRGDQPANVSCMHNLWCVARDHVSCEVSAAPAEVFLLRNQQLAADRSTTSLDGVLYAPATSVTFTGNGTTTNPARYGSVIASQVHFTGNSAFAFGATLPSGPGNTHSALVN
jgi:hypothetical protein